MCQLVKASEGISYFVKDKTLSKPFGKNETYGGGRQWLVVFVAGGWVGS